jgi:hypothetical protein
MLSLLQFKKLQSYHPQTERERERQRESLMRKIFVSGHRVQSPAQFEQSSLGCVQFGWMQFFSWG